MNSLKLFLMMTGLALILGPIGLYFGGSGGLVMALAVAIVFNLIAYWYSDKMVIRMYRAKEATEQDHPRLYKIVRNIALYADNAPIPKLYIIPTKAPNAFATGRNAENAAIAVTEGLLEMLDDQELEGVIGHEFAHIQNNDILLGTVAATFVAAIGILASFARWGAIFGGYSRDNERGSGFPLLVMALLSPLIAAILQAAISRQREFLADKRGAGYTQKYLPLANALGKLHTAPYRLNLDKHPATASMMIANPISGRGFTKLFSTHPPAEERIKRLKELAAQPNFQGIA
jgi:heat shock protein HtpX